MKYVPYTLPLHCELLTCLLDTGCLVLYRFNFNAVMLFVYSDVLNSALLICEKLTIDIDICMPFKFH